jgi:hypothetical protein
VPNSYAATINVVCFVADYVLGPVVAAVCITGALRQRLSSPWVWAGLAVTALLSGVFGFYMNILPTLAGSPGGAVFSALPHVWVDGRISGSATLGMMALRSGVLFSLAAVALQTLRPRVGPALA